jgi:hypothetical protein
LAAIMKVVENRTNAKFSHRSRVLRDIGISESANPRITNILADWQFSAWNDRDNSLARILNFNPEKSDASTREKMRLSFEAQQKMQDSEITFVGGMNNTRVLHYHANYVTPNWARRSNRIDAALINVDGTTVNLSQQSGARHIFYSGVR